MALDNIRQSRAYGVDQALLQVFNAPIVSRRNPTTRDAAQMGQMWVNRTTGVTFILSRIVANAYTWYAAAAAAAAYTAAGLVTAGTGLVAVTGGGTLTGAGLEVQADGADIVGNTNMTGTLTVSSTITNTLGNITATAGNIVSTLGDIRAVNGNIYTDAGDILTILGNIEAVQGNITATQGNIVATLGDITATSGDLNMVNGDIVFTAAATGVTLPGGPRIVTGAGAPAGAMAQGSLYIRTDGGADTLLYVESDGAGTWLAFENV